MPPKRFSLTPLTARGLSVSTVRESHQPSVLIMQADDAWQRGQAATARSFALRALRHAEQASFEANELIRLGRILIQLQEPDLAMAVLCRAIDAFQPAGEFPVEDDSQAILGDAWGLVGVCRFFRNEWPEMTWAFETAIQAHLDADDADGLFDDLQNLTALLAACNQLDEAIDFCQVELWRDHLPPEHQTELARLRKSLRRLALLTSGTPNSN